MTVTKPIKLQNSLQVIVQSWKDQIICFSPQGEGYDAYFIDARNDSLINYINASCDELRHLGTNYNSLLNKIKEQYYGYLKEAILNTIKYEATRRVVRKQHEWIQSSYEKIINKQKLDAQQQSAEIEKLKQIISEQKQEIAKIKTECRNQLAAIKAEALLKQKEVEIQQKNSEIARLKQQLQESDRQIDRLKFELNNGLSQLKLKYRGLITQLISNSTERQQINNRNKSLQACKNIFMKAQSKINLLQCENKLLRQENIELQGKVKMLRV